MRRRVHDGGLTLVELMVTLVVASLVASSTFMFFSGQQRIYDTQTKILNVQQNLWAAMETLTRHLRAGGTGMFNCVRPDSDGAGPDTGDPGPGGDLSPLTGVRAFRNGTGVIRIPPLWVRDGLNGAPDTLTVAFGNGTFGNNFDATISADVPLESPGEATVISTALPGVFRPGEFMLLLDATSPPLRVDMDRGCTLFQITTINANQLLHASTSVWNPANHVAGMIPFPYLSTPAATAFGIRDFGRLVWAQFAIDTTGGMPPRLTLNRLEGTSGPQVLAEGVEDLQIAYACDINADGDLHEEAAMASRRTTAGNTIDEWIYNHAQDETVTVCKRPVAVRITLIARSMTEDSTLSGTPGNAKPAAENGAGGATDSYRHRVISTTVFPRN